MSDALARASGRGRVGCRLTSDLLAHVSSQRSIRADRHVRASGVDVGIRGCAARIGAAMTSSTRRSAGPAPREPSEPPRRDPHRRRGDGADRGHAAGAPPRARRQLLQRRRPRRGRLRRAGHRVRGAARLRRVPRLHELRLGARRRRGRGADRRAAGRDRAALPRRGRGELTAELVCYARSVAGVQWQTHGGGHAGRQTSTRGPCQLFRTLQTVEPADGQPSRPPTASGSTSGRPGGRPQRPDPRRGRRDPDAAVARAVLHRGGDLRLHAVLRRQRRTGRRPGAADGQRGRRDRVDAAAAAVPQPPVPPRHRRSPSGRHAAAP